VQYGDSWVEVAGAVWQILIAIPRQGFLIEQVSLTEQIMRSMLTADVGGRYISRLRAGIVDDSLAAACATAAARFAPALSPPTAT
jgi:hypothetical protein